MQFKTHTLLFIALTIVSFFSTTLQADEKMSEQNACKRSSCIEKNSWQIGVAVGIGARSNPLVDGDHIPLVIVPDIAWYGEYAYFDNGELGYQWLEKERFSSEIFVAANSERAFFSFWHPSNVLTPIQASIVDISLSPSRENSTPVSVDSVAKRKWALDAGVRLRYQFANQQFMLSLLNDVSGVYKGQQADLRYQYRWKVNDWLINISPRLLWKSSELIHYYYGLSERDNVDSGDYYQGRAGWQAGLSFSAIRQIDAHWYYVLNGGYQTLHSGMTDSPLVEDDNVRNLFIGMAYRF